MLEYKNFYSCDSECVARHNTQYAIAISGTIVGALVSKRPGLGALVGTGLGVLCAYVYGRTTKPIAQVLELGSKTNASKSSNPFSDLPVPPMMQRNNEMALRAGKADMVVPYHEVIQQAHNEFVTKHNSDERLLDANCPKELARLQSLAIRGESGIPIGYKIPTSEFKFQEALFEFSCVARVNARKNWSGGDGVTSCQRNPEMCKAIKRVYGSLHPDTREMIESTRSQGIM